MFICSHSGLVDWPVGRFLTNIEDHDGTVVATGCDQSWARWVEVDAHHTRLSGENVLRPGGVTSIALYFNDGAGSDSSSDKVH